MKFVFGLVGLSLAMDTPAWESCMLDATKTCEFGYCCSINLLRFPTKDPAQVLATAKFDRYCLPRIVLNGANTYIDNALGDVAIADSTTAFYNTEASRLQNIVCADQLTGTCQAYSIADDDNTYGYTCGAAKLVATTAMAVAAMLY